MTNDTAVSPILGTLLALAMLVLVCAPVMAANVTYPQEYYAIGNEIAAGYDHIDDYKVFDGFIVNFQYLQWKEMRRQTILMEKQNELLAEQNELMGRLVNATEIKFVVYPNPVYATQATSWSLDDPETSPSFNVSDYEYHLGETP